MLEVVEEDPMPRTRGLARQGDSERGQRGNYQPDQSDTSGKPPGLNHRSCRLHPHNSSPRTGLAGDASPLPASNDPLHVRSSPITTTHWAAIQAIPTPVRPKR